MNNKPLQKKRRKGKIKNPAAVALGKSGGNATLKKHGKEYYSKIGTKAAQAHCGLKENK